MTEISTNYTIFLNLITSFLISFLAIPSIIKVAKEKNLMDFPDNRKAHTVTVPTLGGLAIFGGFVLSTLLWVDCCHIPRLQYILSAIIIMFFIGIKDDILITAPITKLIGQLLAVVLLVIFGDVRITSLHGFLGIYELNEIISLPISILFITFIINATNLIDGIDGLASGVGIIATLCFSLWFYFMQETDWAIIAGSLNGALIAFFIYNFFGTKNKIFMGDTGSLILGLLLATFAIIITEKSDQKPPTQVIHAAPAMVAGILILPIFDTLRVIFIRLIIQTGIFNPDNNHIHHRLIQYNFSHKKATILLLATNIFFILISYWFSFYFSIKRILLIQLLLCMVFVYVPAIFWKKKHTK